MPAQGVLVNARTTIDTIMCSFAETVVTDGKLDCFLEFDKLFETYQRSFKL
jgi:hypothetical protein